jgi:hypothetical protein
MFKNDEKMSKMREITHFKHQKTINEHLIKILAIYLQQKKILMVKVYG